MASARQLSSNSGSVINVSAVFSAPPREIYRFPVGLDLPPSPPAGSLFAASFATLLDIRVPITIATVYATAVHVLNRSRGGPNSQPTRFARTKLFRWLVIAHNMFLCVYSAWTCVGMMTAIMRTVLESSRMAPRGSSGMWRGLCSLSDGLWEHGLSYYGFLFYLSKFYEVVDTAIILAKGKKSSLLQTYHHAGAMLSMWAGIRFASPPIWVFVVFNSLIHTLMYLYYTLSGLHVPVPKAVKRALTTAQICQFVFGGSLASMHLFVSYFDPGLGQYTACMTDAGQSFALFFILLYLTPLTYLFVSFWIDSYMQRGNKARKGGGPGKVEGKMRMAETETLVEQAADRIIDSQE
ncbi:GNS1/SUR4 family-domain-containing protein [Limtongia smithiae]|uniref:GNS1/SUR4 family-domain-containing protein n=1 Tax=Limtongia smithiae TaxID=1125753 RepID=UPI0034CDB7D3